MERVRIGVLGAARIAPKAIVLPARTLPEAEIVAVAARDRARATEFASKHGIPRVHTDYTALLADDEIDAVYNPFPTACTVSGRSPRSRPASTCCARSRSPRTPPKRKRSPTPPRARARS